MNRLHASRTALAAVFLIAGACDRAPTDLTTPSGPGSVSFAKSTTASKSFSENFNLNRPSTSLLEATGIAPSYTNGAVTFDLYDRGYLRTIAADYNTTDFIADVTVSVTSHWIGGAGITFFGIGDGVPSSFYAEPASNAAVYARLMPDDFFGPKVELTTSIDENPTTISTAVGEAGDGTHRLRISWNHVTSELTFSIATNWVPGTPFIPTAVMGPVAVPGLFNGTNAHIFFGGAGYSTFDDLRVVALPSK